MKRTHVKLLLTTFVMYFSYMAGLSAFPSVYPKGTTILKPTAYPGYTLFTPLGGGTGHRGENLVYLINNQGKVVKQWKTASPPGAYGYLLPNGHLLFAANKGNCEESAVPVFGGGSPLIQELDQRSRVVWEYCNPYMHHDMQRLDNGNLLVLVTERMSMANQARVKGGVPNTELDGAMWSDAVIEVDAKTREIIWSWHAQDKLTIEDHQIGPLDRRQEWTHANSLQYLKHNSISGNKPAFLISFRELSVVMLVDKLTGDVIWQSPQGMFNHQHAPHMLENGNILLFDNGMHRSDDSGIPRSRVVEIDPRSNRIVWQYVGNGQFNHKFFSSIISSAQRLANGNTLITEGINGRIFEVSSEMPKDKNPTSGVDPQIVWEYVIPYFSHNEMANSVFRSIKYDPSVLKRLSSQ